jgi:pilus assembly protein CpaB
MRAKSWILLVVALGCGLVASVAVSQVVLDQRKGPAQVAMTEIVVTVKDLAAGAKIAEENLKLEKWPTDRVPQGAITDIKEVAGKFAKQPLFQGEPLVPKKLNATDDSIANNIPEGFMVFDFAVDAKTGGIGYIKPGNRVDVFGFFEKSSKVPQTKSVRVIEDVAVFMVDGNASRESSETGGKQSQTVQLLIRESQYEALTTAANLGKLRLALRRDAAQKSTTDNGEEFMSWIRANESKMAQSEPGEMPSQAEAKPVSTAKSEMTIITPNGLTKFEWSDDSEIPNLVGEKDKDQLDDGPARSPAGNTTWNPSTGQWTTGGLNTSYPPATSDPASKENGKTSTAKP